MNIKELEAGAKKDFNNAICLIGLIPFAVFIYLFVEKFASFNVLVGEVGYIMLITIILIFLGIVTGRRMLWTVIRRLFDFNQTVIQLQDELIQKNRLAAVTETALSLSHEVNNPLMIMRGNLELLETDFTQNSTITDAIKDKVIKLKNYCERIRKITDKLSHLTDPQVTTIHGKTKMIDADSSQ
ncbi:MAG: hypothetical protein HQ572_00365 [Candidatus Omnitrophica bacterium]|nr:hypothetical protein [Candidatus Omnitrophota bacterium]